MKQALKSALKRAQRSSRELGIAVVTSAPVLALAQVTDPFEAQVAAVQTKVESYLPLLAGLAGVTVVLWVAIKYIKKIRGVA